MNPTTRLVSLAAALVAAFSTSAADRTKPLAGAPLVFPERDGVVVVEAEHFHRQTLTDQRAWHITSAQAAPRVEPDGDPAHLEGASGGAYVELLPDTRRTSADKLVPGENFTNEGGKMAVLAYKISVAQPGRFYVWVRAYSTTSEDNGLHFGLDGQWPESGARWQTVQKNGWNWDCKQRTEKVHTGVPMQLWLDLAQAGDHELLMAMREDGIEVDQIALARDLQWRPPGYAEPAKAAADAGVAPPQRRPAGGEPRVTAPPAAVPH